MGKKKTWTLAALALTASVATIGVAHAGTAYFWLDAYPNNSDADQAAVAAAGGISHATGSVEFKTINFDSRTSSTGYVVDGWLATGGVAYAGPGATSGMDNTLWDFTGVDFLTTGETITIDHDDGVSLYIDNVLVPGFTAGSTPPDAEHVTYTGPTGYQSFSLVYGEDDGPPAVLTSNLTNVPEPSTWAMMLLGFAVLGVAGYRKAKKHTLVAG